MDTPDPTPFVAWYRRDQWEQLLAVADDSAALEATYDEWLAAMTSGLAELERNGINALPIDVDVDALIAWCAEKGRPLNGSARAEFAAHEASRRTEGAS